MKILVSCCLTLLFACKFAHGQALDPAGWKTLRVCADPNSMPLSNQKQEGFENKIAELMAKELGWSLKYHWFPQRLAFFRNTIRYISFFNSYF